MSKVILGSTPKTYAATITVPMLDGTSGVIPVTYKYRTQIEFGQLVDTVSKDTREFAGQVGEDFSMSRWMSMTVEKKVDGLLEILDGWGLDAPFDRENLTKLVNEIPAAFDEISGKYRIACTQGRLGN